MKKTLSLIMLSALIITSGIQAQPSFFSNPINKIIAGATSLCLAAATYNYYYKEQNGPAADIAYADQEILKSFIGKINSQDRLNGLAAQVASLHISDAKKATLNAAIQAYDKAIEANDLQATQKTASDLTAIIDVHMNKLKPTLSTYYSYKKNFEEYRFGAAFALVQLGIGYCFHSSR